MAPTPTPCARHGFISRRRIGEGGWRKGVDVWDFVDSETKKRRACTPHPRQHHSEPRKNLFILSNDAKVGS